MEIKYNISLKPYNTFGIDAEAKAFVSIAAEDSLTEAVSLIPEKEPLLVLGGGSNVLFTRHFNGWVLKNEIPGIEVKKENENNIWVEAGAGVNWHQFVLYCIEKGWAGLENLSLIPGCVGASPMQNIGAYGVEIKDVFEYLEAYSLHEKTFVTFSATDCKFGYRESVFKKELKNRFVITRVCFRLSKKPFFHTTYGSIQQELETMGVTELTIKAISDAVIRIRQGKLPDPAVTGNAGSFFKNPEIDTNHYLELKYRYPELPGYPASMGRTKVPAGWLIEKAGWKGYREGDAGVHDRQALVLVNYGQASGEQIYTLSEKIMNSVLEKFGIELEREVNIY
ncbi:MAG: UDP-N-acetylmuramate dehydrogenase [Chitinophagaceae bacterium]|nr:UDP-N-acetylmuramate dehydrogenase [Chitinophagaceae bacterium]